MLNQDFASVLDRHPWAQELAGILPLSSLIDFLDVPLNLHIYQLTGVTPWWCWPVTPAGSRLLLSEPTDDGTCCLDRFGQRENPICLDGRYGDQYHMASPETVRLCLETCNVTSIANNHVNMKKKDIRVHTIEIVKVTRTSVKKGQKSLYESIFSILGWILIAGLIALAVIMECWLLLCFVVVVPMTGCIVFLVHGRHPRLLRIAGGSDFNRLVLTALHMNDTHWRVFYGESSIVNSLLNWPLRKDHEIKQTGWYYMWLLRLLILGQWVLAVGATSIKGWDAYGITFWVIFCIVIRTFVFTPKRSTTTWLKHAAEIKLERFETLVSSRRALLNTVMALNPDTFEMDKLTHEEKRDHLSPGALGLIDPILKTGHDRSAWEEASRLAMIGTAAEGDKGWRKTYGTNYWCDYIPEGIEVAASIREQAQLTGRFVPPQTVKV